MRKKKWAMDELNSSNYYIKSEDDIKTSISDLFPKKQPINLEVGCGKGVFTSKIAALNRNINFFAIDLSTDVLGCAKRNINKVFSENGYTIDNVLLMRYKAEDLSKIINKEDNVQRIYINFCNPWPKSKHKKRRLTFPRQLEIYKQFLNDNGRIYFKTDAKDLFIDSKSYFKESNFKIVRESTDLIHENYSDESKIETEHEIMFVKQGKPIYFLEACNIVD